MRHTRLLPSALVAILSLAACTAGSSAPAWTYAPAPSSTPVPSAAASAGASGGPAASASAPTASASAPAASGSPAASGGAEPSGSATAGDIVKVSAMGIAYEQTSLTVPAGKPFKIEFENKDAGVPHDVAIHQGEQSGPKTWSGEVFTGVATKTYDAPALTAGPYAFVCSVHPNMVISVTAQ